jgi:prevent-host-death family protein
MRISVTDAKNQLASLMRRAEAGDEVILTRYGRAAVRLGPIRSVPGMRDRRTLLDAARLSGAAHATAGPGATRSQDFPYGELGWPE